MSLYEKFKIDNFLKGKAVVEIGHVKFTANNRFI